MDDQALIAKLLARLDEVETRLSHVEAYRAKLVREVKSLREENTILRDKVRELTARINQDSSNSSKPPSTDKPWKERRPNKPTGRSRGGQPGHEGTTREPFPPDQVDFTVRVPPTTCSSCARGLGEKDLTGKTLPHQVVEIPPVVAQVTEYVLHEALFRKLLFNFDGILGTDQFSVYRVHDKEKRQLCWAHLLRNFLGLEELGGTATSLGVGGQRIVKAVFREWYRFRDGELTRRGLQRRLAPIRLRLQRLLRRHVNNPATPARKIARDLREYGSALWTFVRVEGIEPTNNIAERALRKAVLWRKNSYGSASRGGSLFVERMLTVCESLRAQGRSILDFLVEAVSAAALGRATPSLLPAA